MNLNDVDALSFDCYGTLIDWESGLAEQLGKIAPDLDDETRLTTYADIEAELERDQPTTPYREIVLQAALAFGEAVGIAVTPELAEEIGASVGDWPAFADSAEALAQLQPRYKLIILSNIDNQSFAGSNRQLGVEFDAVLTAEDIGSYKPSPRNFEALLAHVDAMGIPRHRLVHVAQSLFHDHVPAKDAGLTTVWINRRHNRPGTGATPEAAPVQPDWEFPSMAAFAEAALAERPT